MNAPASSDIDRMRRLFEAQRSAFSMDTVPGVSARRMKLRSLARLVRARRADIVRAVGADFGCRSADETISGEIAVSVASIEHTCRHLDRWAAPTRLFNRGFPVPGRTYVRHEPKGVVGVVAPWNYPFQLVVVPAAQALSGGNRVLVKPSELAPHTGELLQAIFAEIYEEADLAVVPGGPDVGKAFGALPFDHLFFTGSTRVGRKVALAAAENLTPVTLELGGKSPCIMLPDADPQRHAPLVAFGRFFSAGQSCVAPDYLLVPAGRGRAFAEAILARARAAFPSHASNPGYTAIISDGHHDRLTAMLDEARRAGATVLDAEPASADPDCRKLPPTVVLDPPLDGTLMREEIFGPILPIMEYGTIDDAVRFVGERDRPLALYVFGDDVRRAERVIARTVSGGAMVNGTMVHFAVEKLPFGGIGTSGQGAYHGRRGFDEFTHQRSVMVLPQWPILRETLARSDSALVRRVADFMIGR